MYDSTCMILPVTTDPLSIFLGIPRTARKGRNKSRVQRYGLE
jgi:hypothetical protein